MLSFDGAPMDLPSGRKFLRFGKLKSNFFKEFSQNQCVSILLRNVTDLYIICMRIRYRTLTTVDLRTSKMKQRNTMYSTH